MKIYTIGIHFKNKEDKEILRLLLKSLKFRLGDDNADIVLKAVIDYSNKFDENGNIY